ncbi:phosphoribosylaminoimidazole-succinocarboxamide synthase [Ignisphaera aggregans DSM 17230]|uniref:Phosphoribosylaminoimidazole-succinocarboxamide synthase n=1 Tax=Ignisphaera aggregans (strain DSM 17230 / JCM 13409 / AQ1.S1) TaxID=583356 RepID=E0SQN6_IGNAA|nr:phosphoribosylaminoimidazole-succinocarboxamide synthase [Ignisphaera aggregans DSM 17230]
MSLKILYEGKSKRVYVKNEDELVMEFKDDVTAMDGAIKASASGKGVLAARMSAYFFKVLEDNGIETHYIDYDGTRNITVKRLSIVPIEVIVRNYAYGSLLKRMPLYKSLQKLDPPLIEFHYKDDSLHDPLILPEDILNVGLLSRNELDYIVETTLRVNKVLDNIFSSKGLRFVDLKLEFGRDKNGRLIVADEISGDTFRVLDENGNHLDKEIFRKTKDVNIMVKAYIELCKRLGIEVKDVVSS